MSIPYLRAVLLGLRLKPLPATELGELLAPLKGRYKVMVISTCYSGGLISSLKDGKTLIMTAARARFAEALNEADDLEQAFANGVVLLTQSR